MPDSAPPTSCKHCGAVDNFFLLQNIHFCGQCGRKQVASTVTHVPVQPAVASTSALSQSTSAPVLSTPAKPTTQSSSSMVLDTPTISFNPASYQPVQSSPEPVKMQSLTPIPATPPEPNHFSSTASENTTATTTTSSSSSSSASASSSSHHGHNPSSDEHTMFYSPARIGAPSQQGTPNANMSQLNSPQPIPHDQEQEQEQEQEREYEHDIEQEQEQEQAHNELPSELQQQSEQPEQIAAASLSKTHDIQQLQTSAPVSDVAAAAAVNHHKRQSGSFGNPETISSRRSSGSSSFTHLLQDAKSVSSSAPVTAAATTTAVTSNSSDSITLTAEEYAALEERIRAEMLSSFSQEQEVLTLEFAALQESNDKLTEEKKELEKHLTDLLNGHSSSEEAVQRLTKEKKELEKTLDEMMASFQNLLDETNNKKADYAASINILETEIEQIRQGALKDKSLYTTTLNENLSLRANLEEKTRLEIEWTAKNNKLEKDYENLKVSYDKLHKQAQEKLTQSGQEYRLLLNKLNEKEMNIQTLQDDQVSLRNKNAFLEGRNKEFENLQENLQIRLDAMDSTLKNKNQEVLSLGASVTSLTAQVNEYKMRYDESNAIANRYKDQILEYRNKIRDMQDYKVEMESAVVEKKKLHEEMESMSAENKSLKSQLFDLLQTERSLRSQLEGRGMTPASPSIDRRRVQELQEELNRMQAYVQTKEVEHKELMTICNDLIQQVETLKQQQGK